MFIFQKRNAGINKIKEILVLQGIFSSVILTISRQREFYTPTAKRTPQKPT